MLRFHGMAFAAMVAALDRIVCILNVQTMLQDDSEPLSASDLHAGLHSHLNEAIEEWERLPLSPALKWQMEKIMELATPDRLVMDLGRVALAARVQTLQGTLLTELAAKYYLEIPADRRVFYEQPKPMFGDQVARVFPEASEDIAAACRCIALDEWTASVFHSMRVAEHGLTNLAKRLDLDVSSEGWYTLIGRIEKVVRAVGDQKRGSAERDNLQFYGEASSQLWMIKEAWRNHVSHARSSYNEVNAHQVLNTVRVLVKRLAAVEEAEDDSE